MLAPIDTLAGQLKDAVCDPLAWPTALESMNAFVDGSGIVLLSIDERLKHAPCTADLMEMMDDYFRSEWHANDCRESCRSLLIQQGIVLDYEFLRPREIEDYHAQFVRKHNRKWFAGLGAHVDGDVWCLALQRSVGKGPFGSNDTARLRAAQTLFKDAAWHARNVSRHWINGAITALDCHETAAVLLDHSGHILEASAAARSIATGCQAGGLGMACSVQTRSWEAFERLLTSKLFDGRQTRDLFKRIEVVINQNKYILEATCLRNQSSLTFSKASVLLLIHPKAPDPREELRKRYGLTQAEVRIATALATGFDVKAMAQSFSVATATIRTQLKSAYAKTNTSGQAQLAALVAQLSKSLPG